MLRTVYIASVVCLLFTACETDITLELPVAESKIVVEGFIENDQPPFVSLTRTIPFYGEIDLGALDNYFVNDATVIVSDGDVSVTLTEYCLEDLPEALKPLLADVLGITVDSITGEYAYNACLYTVPDILSGTPAFVGAVGKTYSLLIIAGEDTLTASTRIPELVAIDSMYYRPASEVDPANDSLVRCYGMLSDPAAPGNYYRMFTSRNNDGYQPDISSVTDDLFFNGQTFEFPIPRVIEPGENYDPDTYGYYWKGDTVGLRWTTIDYASFDFWRTLESDYGSDGPFTSVTIAATNIRGGLGIWCGYGALYYELIVPL